MKTKGDTGKRKTFVNTTLGETWEAKIGERPDAELMAERKEHYSAPVPDRVALPDCRYRLPAGPLRNARMGMGAG